MANSSSVIKPGTACAALKGDQQARLSQFGYRRDFGNYYDVSAGSGAVVIYSAPVADLTRAASIQKIFLCATDSAGNNTQRELTYTWTCAGPLNTPVLASAITQISNGVMVLNLASASTIGTSTSPPTMILTAAHGTNLAFQLMFFSQTTDTGPNAYIAPSSSYPLGVISRSYYNDADLGLNLLGTDRYYRFQPAYDGTVNPITVFNIPMNGTVNGSLSSYMTVTYLYWSSIDTTGRTYAEIRTIFTIVTGRGLPVILTNVAPFGGGPLPVTPSFATVAGNATTAPSIIMRLTPTAPGVQGTSEFWVRCMDMYPNPYSSGYIL